MNTFSTLGITPAKQGLEGDKIKIDRIVNREIIIHKYDIKPSKFADKGNKECLYIQIELSGNQHVVFTGSGILMDMIKKVKPEQFPFKTTIVRDNERFIFT